MLRFALPVLLLAAAPAAAEEIVTSRTEGQAEPAAKIMEVAFVVKDCEEECHVASLTCNENRSIGFVYADVPSADAARAMTGKQEIRIEIGKKSYPFSITTFTFSEMTGSWWVDAGSFADPLELLAALGAAKSFTAVRPGGKVTLPVTEDVKSWAVQCRGTD